MPAAKSVKSSQSAGSNPGSCCCILLLRCSTDCTGVECNLKTVRQTFTSVTVNVSFYTLSLPWIILGMRFSQKHFVVLHGQTWLMFLLLIRLSTAANATAPLGSNRHVIRSALSAGISAITLLRRAVIDATLDPHSVQKLWGGGRHSFER